MKFFHLAHGVVYTPGAEKRLLVFSCWLLEKTNKLGYKMAKLEELTFDIRFQTMDNSFLEDRWNLM